jgi:transposase-like protein
MTNSIFAGFSSKIGAVHNDSKFISSTNTGENRHAYLPTLIPSATLSDERTKKMTPDIPGFSTDPALSADQHQVLTLLAGGHTLTSAAEGFGIHRNTIRNWRQSIPAFTTALARASREQARAFQEEALDAVPLATQAILAVLNDPATPPALRLRAAGMILKMADVSSAAAPERETVFDLGPAHPSSPEPDHAARVAALRAGFEARAASCAAQNNEISAQSCTIAPIRKAPEPGRNSACPCGSGLKYKRCCALARAA